jgi:Tol biopolymer transport system component
VVALGFVGAWGWIRAARASADREVFRLDVNLPPDQLLSIPPTRAFPFDLSPDGRLLVYAAVSGGTTRLYLRPLDSFQATALPGTEGARQPFFSWSGDRIGFFAGGRLRWVPREGGAPFDVTTIRSNPAGASWGPDDEIVFGAEAARFLGAALYRVPAAGGVPQPFEMRLSTSTTATADSITNDGYWPRHLPDGRHILFTHGSRTWLADLRSGESEPLIAGSQAQYVPSQHLVYVERGPVLRSISFDPAASRVSGEPAPLLEDVFRGFASGGRLFRVARESGTLVFVEDRYDRSVVLVDREGNERMLGREPRAYRWPVPSPDGSRIVVHEQESTRQWEFDVATGRATPLGGDREFGIFRPDGRYFAGLTTLTEIGPDGRPRGDPLIDWGERIYETDWALDGTAVIGQTIAAGSGFDMWIARAADGWRRDTLIVTDDNEHDGKISPDGRWLAYTSDRSGREEVWVASLPAVEGSTLVSAGGGTSPLWSRDGSEIFYRSGDRVMVVPVSTGQDFGVTGAPAVLFRGDYGPPQVLNWALAPDGRFVMIRHAPNALRQFHVITNLGAELAAAGRSR